MASSCKGNGAVKTQEWAKHLRPYGKRKQNKRVRANGRQQCSLEK